MLIGYPLFLNRILSAYMNDLALGWCLYSGLIPIVLCLKDYILNVTCNLMANDIVADLIMQITQKEILAVQAYSSDTINRSLHSYAFLLCSYYLYCGLDMLVSVLSVALMLGKMCIRDRLYTSHDLNTIERICDEIILLDHGKVIYLSLIHI